MRRSIKGSEENWIEMQNDTFKNWVNANLKPRGMEINDFETDFEDGVKLINLFEAVSKKSIGKYAKQPKFANQKLENVSLVLRAMEGDGVKLVSIDSDHVVNGNSKMILGLIWRLILRYQISGSDDKSVKIALKKLLLIWLQHVIPEQRITNLTTDWNNGIALCNLINVLKPGLFPEYNYLDKDAPINNVTKAMQLADLEMGIPQIISPQNMVSPNVDELSMMTYLSYFTQDNGIGESWTANLVNSWNPSLSVTNFNTDWNDGKRLGRLVETFLPGAMSNVVSGENVENCQIAMEVAEEKFGINKIITPNEMSNPQIPELAVMSYIVQFTKVKRVERASEKFSASGPGLVEPKVGRINEFYVRSDAGYSLDKLQVTVIGPSNNYIPIQFEDPDLQLRNYSYGCEEHGQYHINIIYEGEDIPRSPILVTSQQDLNTIKVYGEGLGGSFIFEETEFTVDVGSRNSYVKANIDGPGGSKPTPQIINNNDGTYTVRYTPNIGGTHQIYLAVDNQQLPGGPIETNVTHRASSELEAIETVAVTAIYEEDKHLYAELYERIGISVDTSHSGDGTVTAKTIGPDENEVYSEIDVEEDGSYTVSFTPEIIGEYYTNVFWSGKPIHGSPFIVWVSDPNKILARGKCLYETRVGIESSFEVAINGAGPGYLNGYAECNGTEYPVNVNKREEYLYEISFIANQVGIYHIHVNYNNVPIKDSPFRVKVGNPSLIEIKKHQETVVRSNLQQSFTVNISKDAGFGDIFCVVRGPSGEDVSCDIREINDGQKEILFDPKYPGTYEAFIYYAGGLVEDSPFNFIVPEPKSLICPENIRVTGNGLSRAKLNEVARFKVDAADAGPGHLTVQIEDEKDDIEACISDNNNGTYDVTYIPERSGRYKVLIKWSDQHITSSPFEVTVDSQAKEVKVQGYGIKEGTAGQPVLFTLDGRNAGPGQLSCRCRAPSGKMTYVLISDNKNGTYTVDLNATEPGLHTVEVEWDNQPIPGSPFLVRIMQAADVKKVRASGPGLRSGTLENFNGIFQVDSKGAGPGTLKVRIHGPKGAFKVEMSRGNPKDRIINVRYNPTEPGTYTANIYWSDEHVQGSPFEIFVGQNDQEVDRWNRNKVNLTRSNFNRY